MAIIIDTYYCAYKPLAVRTANRKRRGYEISANYLIGRDLISLKKKNSDFDILRFVGMPRLLATPYIFFAIFPK